MWRPVPAAVQSECILLSGQPRALLMAPAWANARQPQAAHGHPPAHSPNRLTSAHWPQRTAKTAMGAWWVQVMCENWGGLGAFEPGAASMLHLAWSQKVSPQRQTPEAYLVRGRKRCITHVHVHAHWVWVGGADWFTCGEENAIASCQFPLAALPCTLRCSLTAQLASSPSSWLPS